MRRKKIQMVSEPLANYPIPEFIIGYRSKGQPMEQRVKVQSSRDFHELTKEIFTADTIEWVESFILICLNRANKPIGFYKISLGGVAGTVADPKVIFQCALLCNASAIMIAHNHPNGNATASQQDIELTKKIKEGGKLLEIQLLDHLIELPNDKYFSFADEGLL